MALLSACLALPQVPSLSALEMPTEQGQTQMSPARALLLGRLDLIPSDVAVGGPSMAARILHVNREYTMRQEAEQQNQAQKVRSEPATA